MFQSVSPVEQHPRESRGWKCHWFQRKRANSYTQKKTRKTKLKTEKLPTSVSVSYVLGIAHKDTRLWVFFKSWDFQMHVFGYCKFFPRSSPGEAIPSSKKLNSTSALLLPCPVKNLASALTSDFMWPFKGIYTDKPPPAQTSALHFLQIPVNS